MSHKPAKFTDLGLHEFPDGDSEGYASAADVSQQKKTPDETEVSSAASGSAVDTQKKTKD